MVNPRRNESAFLFKDCVLFLGWPASKAHCPFLLLLEAMAPILLYVVRGKAAGLVQGKPLAFGGNVRAPCGIEMVRFVDKAWDNQVFNLAVRVILAEIVDPGINAAADRFALNDGWGGKGVPGLHGKPFVPRGTPGHQLHKTR